jgi:hypothetical protein
MRLFLVAESNGGGDHATRWMGSEKYSTGAARAIFNGGLG